MTSAQLSYPTPIRTNSSTAQFYYILNCMINLDWLHNSFITETLNEHTKYDLQKYQSDKPVFVLKKTTFINPL